MIRIGEAHGVRFPPDFGLLLKQSLYFDRCAVLLCVRMYVFAGVRARILAAAWHGACARAVAACRCLTILFTALALPHNRTVAPSHLAPNQVCARAGARAPSVFRREGGGVWPQRQRRRRRRRRLWQQRFWRRQRVCAHGGRLKHCNSCNTVAPPLQPGCWASVLGQGDNQHAGGRGRGGGGKQHKPGRLLGLLGECRAGGHGKRRRSGHGKRRRVKPGSKPLLRARPRRVACYSRYLSKRHQPRHFQPSNSTGSRGPARPT